MCPRKVGLFAAVNIEVANEVPHVYNRIAYICAEKEILEFWSTIPRRR
jgi:hypothetical protein